MVLWQSIGLWLLGVLLAVGIVLAILAGAGVFKHGKPRKGRKGATGAKGPTGPPSSENNSENDDENDGENDGGNNGGNNGLLVAQPTDQFLVGPTGPEGKGLSVVPTENGVLIADESGRSAELFHGERGPVGPVGLGFTGPKGDPFKMDFIGPLVDGFLQSNPCSSGGDVSFIMLVTADNRTTTNGTFPYDLTGHILVYDCYALAWSDMGRFSLATGSHGSHGATGPAGVQGPIGPIGPTGHVEGATGPNGPMGATGQEGFSLDVTGVAGGGVLIISEFNVAFLSAGPTGQVGAKGDVGPPGPPGPSGPMGTQGLVGSTGAQGAPGAPSSVTGPAGPNGQRGATGDMGPVGAQGHNGQAGHATNTGATGPKIPFLIPFAMGPVGAVGVDVGRGVPGGFAMGFGMINGASATIGIPEIGQDAMETLSFPSQTQGTLQNLQTHVVAFADPGVTGTVRIGLWTSSPCAPLSATGGFTESTLFCDAEVNEDPSTFCISNLIDQVPIQAGDQITLFVSTVQDVILHVARCTAAVNLMPT